MYKVSYLWDSPPPPRKNPVCNPVLCIVNSKMASTSSTCSCSASVCRCVRQYWFRFRCRYIQCSTTEEGELKQEKRTVVSLLDRLKSPTSADIGRPRKTKTNDPPHGKQRPCRGALATDPKGVTLNQWVKEFKYEPFTVLRGHLFCSACREQLSLKRSIIKNHLRSSKHGKGQLYYTDQNARNFNLRSWVGLGLG